MGPLYVKEETFKKESLDLLVSMRHNQSNILGNYRRHKRKSIFNGVMVAIICSSGAVFQNQTICKL